MNLLHSAKSSVALRHIVAVVLTALAAACTQDFGQFNFGDAGTDSATGVGGESGAGATCESGQVRCGAVCSTLDEAASCGACGNDCGRLGLSCLAGQTCGCSERADCGGGPSLCTESGRCRCGAELCQGGETCDFQGACRCGSDGSCASGELCCPDVGCVDPQTDSEHCGGCGRACDAEQDCSDGTCDYAGSVGLDDTRP